MEKEKLTKFLKSKVDTNEDIIYDKLVKINDISHKLLQQSHSEWNEYEFVFLYNHIKHINKNIAYIKQIYDVLNITEEL